MIIKHTTTFKIRPAGPGDLPALESLAMAHEYRDADYFGRCLTETAGRRAVFIGTENGQAAGCIVLNRDSRYQPFRSAGISEVQDLFVHPDRRRQGLGEALVQAAEAQARQEDDTMIGLAVGLHSGFGAAQRLYARLGYAPDGFGAVYDMQPVKPGEVRRVDDDLCLMLVKRL